MNFGDWAAGRLREQARWGADGLKIWKPFGLSVKDHEGHLVAVDDDRLDQLGNDLGVGRDEIGVVFGITLRPYEVDA